MTTMGLFALLLLFQAPDLVPAPAAAAAPAIARQRFTIRSAILQETRTVFVEVPPSFARSQPGRRYPTIVVLDGEGASATAAVTASAELSRHGLAPESVVVGVENIDPLRGRIRDLTPPGLSVSGSSLSEGGDRFLDFLEQELLPAVDRSFRTAAPRTLIGHSSGGILVTYAAATRAAFRFTVALDVPATLGNNWLARQFLSRAKSRPEPLRHVSYSARFGWSAAAWADVTAAAPPSWQLHNERLANESHESMPMLGAYLGLRQIFADYSRLKAPESPTTSILPYYDGLASAYGGTVEPPATLIGDVVSDLLDEGRGAAARAAFDRLVAAYGEPRNAAATRAHIAEVESRPAPTETVESLLATPFPTPDEARPYLGEWTGESWMNPDDRRAFVLKIGVEQGRVTGQIVQRPGSGAELVRRLEYFTVAPDGFTYGFMNGMRPRGVILFTVRRNGERFEGRMRWGGVDVRLPDGSAPPAQSVVLTKKQ